MDFEPVIMDKLAMFHPTSVLRTPKYEPLFQEKIWFFKNEVCDEGTVSPQTINLHRMTFEHNPVWF